MFTPRDMECKCFWGKKAEECLPVHGQHRHTAPDWCQPEVFGTLNFSAVLIVCDQDKIIHVDQQIL